MNILDSIWNPAVIWFAAGLILLLLEIGVPGLVLFFFGVGAWITAALFLIFNIGLDLQLAVFFVSSLLLLISLRRNLQNLFKGKVEHSDGSESLVGEKAVVTETILPPNRGKVEVHGTNWGAESDTEILSGTTVEITERKNLTLKVKSLK